MDNKVLDSKIDETSIVYNDAYVRGCIIGKQSLIADRVTILNSILDGFNQIGKDCYIQDTTLGVGTYLGNNTTIAPHTTIGKYCNISWNICIGGYNHLYTAVSEYSLYWWNKIFDKKVEQNNLAKGVIIGNDVWIGANATILDGVTIADGAVVGAGAVVTKNVEPYTIVVGNPAKPMKKRFNDVIISKLLNLKWWDWSYEKIQENSDLLSQPLTEDILKKLEVL